MTTAAPTTVEEALLRDVLAHPHELRYRLVLADWWEEHGREERAEFVRVQCALESARRDAWPPNPPPGLRLLELAKRERQLRGTVGRDVLRDIRARTGGHVWTLSPNDSDYPDLPGLTFRRGFVEHVRMPCDAFLRYAGSLFSAQPVLRMTLSDREPDMNTWCGWTWRDDISWPRAPSSPRCLPRTLWRECARLVDAGTPRATSPAESRAILSRAAVAWGREQAGLQPLP